MDTVPSHNFAFLAAHDPLLAQLGGLAELYALRDPNSAILKLRQLAEALARRAAALVGVEPGPGESQFELIRDLERRGLLARDVADAFHRIRLAGNDAAHGFTGASGEAVHLLKLARQLGVWFHRAFSRDPNFKPGPFVPPTVPVDPAAQLQEELAQLRAELGALRTRAEEAGTSAGAEAERARRAREEAEAAATERDVALQLAEEMETLLERERGQRDAALARVREEAARQTPAEVDEVLERARKAASAIDLTEADTRKLIDGQLHEAGWEADSATLRWALGTRPQKGRNLAIAERPTASGPADYVLYAGLTPLAVVEAKRQAVHIPASIEQAKRYSRGYPVDVGETPAGGPWGEYRVPFLFATNGRAYLRQIEDRSGIWFLDARRPTNHPRALEGWYSPDGLAALAAQDVDAAERALRDEPTEYLPLRDYQRDAIRAVEQAMADGRRAILLAMATGTGKTRTLIALVYRLIKAKRVRRVLFLVDRTALGEQALGALQDVRLQNYQSFTDIYDVKELGDLRPDADTRLHVATVQAMANRLKDKDEDAEPVPIDSYDCVVVDEAHRGYTLDREMGDAELTFRSEDEYISTYRRVLDHFDAVKIGLTATPALHTTEIFGPPAYSYSYRQAVLDGWLVDHEPPVRIVTALAEDGIRWRAGEEVPVYDAERAQIDLFRTPDDIALEVEEFNRRVVTENFNRVVCRQLARELDPSAPGKTLVYCVSDEHADLVVRLLKEAFAEQYGAVEDDAVLKITGAADRPLQLIRRYKNERLPSVAVTVDLLTTGIDVPDIANLVFIRRVRSRILYEQMLGRATRLRPELYGPGHDKEVFRIFDAVDLYSALRPHTAMHPVVVNPSITFAQLAAELRVVTRDDQRRVVLDQLVAKLRRARSRIEQRAAEEFEALAGGTPADVLARLRTMPPAEGAAFVAERPALVALLDDLPAGGGGARVLISTHEDSLRRVEHGYGDGRARPQDYLDAFGAFVRTHLNEIPALLVVTQRPRELTRAQLKELKRALDEHGFTEPQLRSAWRDVTNQDIAASIIGFVRQQALGGALVPYAERVRRATQRILTGRAWSTTQRQWLERIAQQLEREVVVDREALDREQFRAQGGGFDRLNRVFDGQLELVLGGLQEEVWRESA